MPLFVAHNGQTFGPHEPEEVAAFLETGTFAAHDHCWQEGWPAWRPLAAVLPGYPAPAPASPAAPPQQGGIPPDIAITGTLTLPGDRTVTCHVDGEIICPATVTIAPGCVVRARIIAESVVVLGTVEGEIRARGRVVLKSTGILHGDIHAARVLVEEGAAFHGQAHVHSGQDATKPADGAANPPATGR
jgi:cytoskeletal protein CcmA (bactofilin family)